MVLKRNPSFGEWNKDEAGNPLPYLDRYEIRIVKDVNAALAEFLAGNIDIFNPSTVDQISQIRQAVQQGRLDATIKVNASPVASSQFMVFNWNKASDPFKQSLFRSDKFRRAMSHLVNRQAVIDIVYGGLGIPMYSSVYPVLTQWINPKVPKYEYDPKQAAKLLAELGFTKKDREGYLVDSKGRRIEFNLATNAGNTQREQIAKLIVDEAKKVGVKVNFQAIDFNTLVGQLLSSGPDRPFDAIIIGLTGGGLDWPFGSNVVPCKGNLHMWNKSGQCLDPRETLMEKLYYQGRTDEAEAVLRAAAAINGTKLAPFKLRPVLADEDGEKGVTAADFVGVDVRAVTLPLFLVWFLFGLTYYGTNSYSFIFYVPLYCF